MIRRRTRIVWGLTGAALLMGSALSLAAWLGPERYLTRPLLREFGALVDIAAVLLWMLIFAVSAGSRSE